MSLLSDWNGYEGQLKNAIKAELDKKRKPPKAVLALLKTSDLKTALKQADTAEAKNDLQAMTKALAASQKFFMMYGNVLKLAQKALGDDDDLLNALAMHSAYIASTQQAVSKLRRDMIEESQKNSKDEKKQRELKLKSVMIPQKFQYDWKAGKKDFESTTKRKKPSEKILGAFRKSTKIEAALAALDKACEDCKPADYRKAYVKFTTAKVAYTKILVAAQSNDKEADQVYKTSCDELKTLLHTIDTRAGRIDKGLETIDD